ncbi:MAG TPA: hypothetical protein VMM84_18885 [Pyrinomonadaceae bacterium]|nr:hypothetical protein [Pyrinomonadaceae bacterium]
MDDRPGAQTRPEQTLIHCFDCEFARLHAELCNIVREVSIEDFYHDSESAAGAPSQSLIRSAAIVEQTFGGITANLWDDPFEWTLPETLTTSTQILEYLAEVEATRKRAFARFAQDSDLLKEIAVPSGNTRPLVELLLETLVHATHYHGRCIAALQLR